MKHDVKEFQEDLMNKADNMAAAAVMFGSHGYDSFIHAREDFKTTLEELKEFVTPNVVDVAWPDYTNKTN